MTETNLPSRILVIDDDQALCELLVEDLSRRGHTPRSALRVDEARELLHNEEIDVVLTDLNMPGTSGIDFCAELQENGGDYDRLR